MKRILIANRGEIARRIQRTAHRMGLETVAVYSDADANALYVREATVAVPIGGMASADSYLRVDKLLAAAQQAGADAVHPGYGFLSEDAGFARAVEAAGLRWIGPPPSAIDALGSKAAAKALAERQGVPCLPGYFGADQTDATFVAAAERVGYPVMVKAVAGGGGRGMRLVSEPAQLVAALASARSEAVSGFGNGDLLIERAVQHPRHVEVQVFADQHGHCIHLGERDCSVQRRNQKIIEEAPSPAVNADLRARMGACAVELARGAGYVGAGTVEFLLEGDAFYLMEMNTRLQVEHPVTEALTGLDLVEWQIRVARGEPLPLAQDQVPMVGHAIEVRLCAEDERFTPHTGTVQVLAVPDGAVTFQRGALRWDHALEVGTTVTPYYDAMLGKLIVHAATREEAIAQLHSALARLCVLGLPTNRHYLMACLEHPVFRAGDALISFIATEGAPLLERVLAAERAAHDRFSAVVAYPQGAHDGGLVCAWARPLRLRWRDSVSDVPVTPLEGGGLRMGHAAHDASPRGALQLGGSAPRVVVTQGGVAQSLHLTHVDGRGWHVQTQGVDWWVQDVSREAATNAGAAAAALVLRAPFNGKVVGVSATVGQVLQPRDTALVIESMKLEHSLSVKVASQIEEVLVQAGQQVAPGQVLLRLKPVDAVA